MSGCRAFKSASSGRGSRRASVASLCASSSSSRIIVRMCASHMVSCRSVASQEIIMMTK